MAKCIVNEDDRAELARLSTIKKEKIAKRLYNMLDGKTHHIKSLGQYF